MDKKNKKSMRMTTILLKTFSLVGLLIAFSCTPDETQVVTEFQDLVFYDEFDTDGLINPDIWGLSDGTGTDGWGNNELQYYTDRTENASVRKGILTIKAVEEDYSGAAYTSARLSTKGLKEQKYGRFEARIKLPTGQGIWPAFWLLGANNGDGTNGTEIWPNSGEIDIMEYRGQAPTIIHGSLHGPGYSAANSITKSYALENDRFDNDFHIFGIEWTASYINYYVDDVLYNQITREQVEEKGVWVFDQPFFIIINLAVGGNFVGAPNNETVFPQTMLVDYVKVYKK